MPIINVTNYMSGPFDAVMGQTFRSDKMTQEGDNKLRNMLMERASYGVSDALKLLYRIFF